MSSDGDRLTHNVCGLIVERDLCIGCGTCAALCPSRRLDIEWNDLGCYVVRETDKPCPSSCRVCLDVCPFVDSDSDEDKLACELFGQILNIKRRSELGYFRSCYTGYSLQADQRLGGASGGMATWFLTELVRRGDVDHVICVAPHPGPRPLFRFQVRGSRLEIEAAARSAYYPVEISQVIRHICENEGRYAITCLPCFAKAIRLAAARSARLNERIVALAGLVCGHTVSSFFAEYASEIARPDRPPAARVTFRTKDERFPAYELGTQCAWQQNGGEETETVFWSEGLGEAWSGHWFTPNPCLYCDDVFAETADVAFMDAWLPEYTSDYRGTNMLVTRSDLAEEVITSGIASGKVKLSEVSPDDIVRSQSEVVANKRRGLAHRLWLARKRGVFVPRKRVTPRREHSLRSALRWRRYMAASGVGRAAWANRSGMESFRLRMTATSGVERLLAMADEGRSLPKLAARCLKRIMAGGKS